MHTIIINTLGNALRQNQLFYLPFPAERFLWIEKNLEDISQCPGEIVAHQNEQGQRHLYHVIVLTSLAHLMDANQKSVRTQYERILRAYINEYCLEPLCQKLQHPPVGVSIVYMLKDQHDGKGNVGKDKELDHIFGFTEEMEDLRELKLKKQDGTSALDVTDLFSDSVTSFRLSAQKQKSETKRKSNYALDVLRENMHSRLSGLQECKYIPMGKAESETLNCQDLEFAPCTTEWLLACLDVQLNMSEHLQQNLTSEAVWQLTMTAHEAADIRERILLAISRVQYLRTEKQNLGFYPLPEQDVNLREYNLTGEIWGELNRSGCLPPELQAPSAPSQSTAPTLPQGNAIGEVMRRKWLLIGLEKKRFEEKCAALEQQFAPEQTRKQEKSILDICAKIFGKWRSSALNRPIGLSGKPTEKTMPAFDEKKYEQKLGEAQRKWGEVSVSQLEDYTDVRQEAEEIKADFRKAYRLWPDGQFNATSKFVVYSAVLAALFLIQMLLPYLFITMGQDGLELSRYLHLSLSIIVFIVLYALGVVLWLHTMCRQLYDLTMRMHSLLQESNRRRNQSITHAVELYGSVFPQCTVCYETLQQLRRIHMENLQRNERYLTHMRMLAKAEEWLYELATLLRMDVKGTVEVKEPVNGIDFEKAPSDEKNMPFYVFMSEKWGEI